MIGSGLSISLLNLLQEDKAHHHHVSRFPPFTILIHKIDSEIANDNPIRLTSSCKDDGLQFQNCLTILTASRSLVTCKLIF